MADRPAGIRHTTNRTNSGKNREAGILLQEIQAATHRGKSQIVLGLLRHAYLIELLIELKYLSRGEDTPAKRQGVIEQARAQLRRYRRDPRVEQHLGPATLHSIVLLYSGWELVHREALEPLSDIFTPKRAF